MTIDEYKNLPPEMRIIADIIRNYGADFCRDVRRIAEALERLVDLETSE